MGQVESKGAKYIQKKFKRGSKGKADYPDAATEEVPEFISSKADAGADILATSEASPQTAPPATATSSPRPEPVIYTIPAACSALGQRRGLPQYAIDPSTGFLSTQQAIDARAITEQGLPHDLLRFGPPAAPNADDHHDTIHALGLSEVPDCPEYNSILAVMCQVMDAPLGAITIIEHNQVWIESGYQCEPGDAPWCNALCPWILLSQHPTTLVVEDMAQDARYSHTVWVQRGMKSYIGAPLVASNGHRLGTICWFDTRVRRISAAQCSIMNNFAELVVRELERHVNLRFRMAEHELAQKAFAHLQRPLTAQDRCVLLVDTAVPGWKIVWASSAWDRVCGTSLPRSEAMDSTLRACFASSSGEQDMWRSLEAAQAMGESFMVEKALLLPHIGTKSTNINSTNVLSSGSNLRTSGNNLPARSSTGKQCSFDLSFRQGGSSVVDELSLLVNIPSLVSMQKELQNLYFVVVNPHDRKAKAKWLANQDLRAQTGQLGDIQGLQLDRLLGRGAFGAVYHGCWEGREVAVKMLQEVPEMDEEIEKIATEIAVAQEFEHPHILRTYAFTMMRHNGESMERYGPRESIDWDEHQVDGELERQQGQQQQQQEQGGADVMLAALPPAGDGDDAAAPAALQGGSSSSGQQGIVEDGRTWAVMEWADAGSMEESGTVTSSQHNSASASMELDDLGMMRPGSSSAFLSRQTTTGLSPNERVSEDGLGATVSAVVVMEYADRGCLQDAIDQGWFLTSRCHSSGLTNMEAVLATAQEVALALAALHERGVVHGDLTGYNVLLSSRHSTANRAGRAFCAKLADFGFSRRLHYTEMLQTNSYGSVTHMPPELLGEGLLSKAADVYSLGVLLWQMYNGSRPWAGMRHLSIVHAVVKERRSLVFPEHTPQLLADLGRRCLAPDPLVRPTCQQIAQELGSMLEVLVPVPLEGEF